MDDEIGKSVCIKCSWKSNYPKDERGVQTDALIVREVAVEPLESSDVQTQTDNATEQSDPGKASLMPIDRRVVQTLMNALENSLHTTFLLSRLNVFHETHHVRLSLIKQFRLQQCSWKSNYPKDERGVQTDALIVREVAVEPLESSDVQTQTDNATEQSDPGKASLMPIDRRVVQTLMNALENSLHTTFLLSRLNVFHETHHVRLSLIKQFRLQQMSNDESLIGMECGTRGRIAFLLGEAYHDSWCSHNGKLLVYRRGESSSITLPGCPSVVSRFPKVRVRLTGAPFV
ncbi:hypothetical protein Tcan_17700 [Toxocara canis]|uniref:Uncharacterized protein n=1 Tax=Toxocara canis TaxID=6265 RepID=A0A0B2UWZ2_TOXCA|nr:hypothetical protein Tcan_17700 [Toxocara canis]